jgi:hypothetical protein
MDQSKKDASQDKPSLETVEAYQKKWDQLMKDTDRELKKIRGMLIIELFIYHMQGAD